MTRASESNSKPRRYYRRKRKRPRPASHDAAGGQRSAPLHERTVSEFLPAERQRGTEYFRQGRVELEVDGARARARVRDKSRSFNVGVDWSEVMLKTVLPVFCECRRFSGGRPCEHVWATLLSLAENGSHNQPPGTDELTLYRDKRKSWKDLETLAEKGNGRPAEPRAAVARPQPNPASASRAKNRSSKSRRRRPAGTTWEARLAKVRREIDRVSNGQPPGSAGPHLKDPENVRFLVNTAENRASGDLVLDVFLSVRAAPRRRSKSASPSSRPSSARSTRLKRIGIEPRQLEELLSGHLGNGQDSTGETATNDAAASDAAGGDITAGDAGGSEPVAVVTTLPVEPRPRQPRGRRGRGKGRPAKVQHPGIRRFVIPPGLYGSVLPRLCSRGMLSWWDGRRVGDPQPLTWDDGPPWRLALRLDVSVNQGTSRLRGSLEQDGQRVPLGAPVAILQTRRPGPALVLFDDAIAPFETVPERDAPWIHLLSGSDEITIPRQELEEAVTALFELPSLPHLDLPEEFELSGDASPPQPRLVLESESALAGAEVPYIAELSFLYDEREVDAGDPRPAIIDWQERSFLRRDMKLEHKALVRLLELGLAPISSTQGHELQLNPGELPFVAEPLLREGWAVEVRGTSLRSSSPPSLRVDSGIDWFELGGEIEFAGEPVEMAAALAAISRGDRFVELSDGSRGLLPESLIETYGSLAELAQSETENGLRFLSSQALLVDGLLAATPPVVDSSFSKLRDKLSALDRIRPKKELKTFGGTLRNYQREGLGWLLFLRDFGLGGVLADDMGLGKTVQVLALLLACKTPKKNTGLPFLVVAPRSLIYNWIDEAARFTPKAKVLEYSGPDREAMRDALGEYDLVLTTYGTLRRDVGYLATVEFDTVVLDEAQAIKNRDSQSAKASRLLVGRNRLALTGTPIENHIGELGSILEFLNPGLFGRLPRLEALASGRTPSSKELQLIAEGTRPFILRRTKEQVLPDLPPKTEQTMHCTLYPRQRELYDQLRVHYQASLLNKVEGKKKLGGAALQVLEALLRLRQIACHPGLVDPEWDEAGSAKLETLFAHLDELREEGHKALVFSQFTKLLAYVRRDLDERGVPYAYLDGQTRDRGEVVERFQTDPDCNLFLISLKAGGVGLNLTAAGYVFLLDPWWNPAVEAQAIDRTHRLGQTQPVFAYRMIARDTVEEKILELQSSKRQLADAILEADGKMLSDLTADDLRMLLS